MKKLSSIKLPLIIGIVIILIMGVAGFTWISKAKGGKALTEEQMSKVRANLGIVCIGNSDTMRSSSPFDYIGAHKKEYDEIVHMGSPVVNYFIDQYKNGKLNSGLQVYIAAQICNDILGKKNPVKKWSEDHVNGWESGGDWFEKYMEIKHLN